MRVENKHAIIAYTQLELKTRILLNCWKVMKYLNGRVGFEDLRIFFNRWENFAGKLKRSAEISVFECALPWQNSL